ncbi:hypothetical protein [Wolbachia endosymbiont of Atemnus politus]|uniref:hypothetical protein n=2 Tax=Wolbachia endosymbiont of Atemnus politus TaxID=2682840 RepID=UPI001FE5ED18|nr:hypothetical protein [Wolbachia endosymbiont of Atemnus politus]
MISDLIFMVTDYGEWQVSCEGYILRRLYLSYGPVRVIISATAAISRDQEKVTPKYYFSDVGE